MFIAGVQDTLFEFGTVGGSMEHNMKLYVVFGGPVVSDATTKGSSQPTR